MTAGHAGGKARSKPQLRRLLRTRGSNGVMLLGESSFAMTVLLGEFLKVLGQDVEKKILRNPKVQETNLPPEERNKEKLK